MFNVRSAATVRLWRVTELLLHTHIAAVSRGISAEFRMGSATIRKTPPPEQTSAVLHSRLAQDDEKSRSRANCDRSHAPAYKDLQF